MPSYNEHNFYYDASDKRGHSRQVRVQPDHHGQIAALLADPSLPYRTYDDFIRDAVVHRLHFLAENLDNEELRQESKRLTAKATLDRQARLVNFERSLVEQLRQTVHDPERRMYLTQDQVDEAIASISTPSLREAAEREVAGFTFS